MSVQAVMSGERRWHLECGDSLAVLRTWPADFVHCCVTSPPYYALRDYKVAGQIGLEKTPAEFIDRLLAVFREVRRVLHPTGVCWVNIGDSYASGITSAPWRQQVQDSKNYGRTSNRNGVAVPVGCKALDVLGIPWQFALAMRADGWGFRSECVWAKPAAMPESMAGWRWQRCRVRSGHRSGRNVKLAQLGQRAAASLKDQRTEAGIALSAEDKTTWFDCPGCKKCEPHGGYVLRRGSWRPTRSHEYLFLFTKSAKYYSDGEPVRTPPASATVSRDRYSRLSDDSDEQYVVRHDHETECDGANLRSVWTIGPEPLPSEVRHFASFPTEIPARCILSGTSAQGVCAACGMPWARVLAPSPQTATAQAEARNGQDWTHRSFDNAAKMPTGKKSGDKAGQGYVSEYDTRGWRPCCSCAAECVPATVLDPFAGTGRTLLTALRLGRRALGIDLSPDYCQAARTLITNDSPLFNTVGA